MAEKFTLARHGAPPLQFSGELIAEADSKSHTGPRQNRWHELALYKTAAGKFVAAVTFRTSWQGEEDRATVFVEAVEKALIDDLQNEFDPRSGWSGHPLGSYDAERKNTLIQSAIVGGYREAVSALLSAAEIVEEID